MKEWSPPTSIAEGKSLMPVRILLADDHEVVREGFRALLEDHGFQVVGEASDGFERRPAHEQVGRRGARPERVGEVCLLREEALRGGIALGERRAAGRALLRQSVARRHPGLPGDREGLSVYPHHHSYDVS